MPLPDCIDSAANTLEVRTVATWQDSPVVTVDTAVGPLRVTIGGSVSAYSDGIRPRHAGAQTFPFEVNAPGTQVVTIHGIDYCAVRIDLTETADGYVALTSSDISGRRVHSWDDMSAAAVKWLRVNVVPQLSDYLATHPEIVREADRAAAAQALVTLERQRSEAAIALRAVEEKIEAVLAVAGTVPA